MALYSLNNIEDSVILRQSTGFPYLDRAFGVTGIAGQQVYGMPRGRIIFASGEPGVGKTRLGIAITKNINALGGKILVFQGEVRPQEFKQWTGSNVHDPSRFFVSDDRDIEAIIGYILSERPDFVVIDSANMINDYDKSSKIKDIFDDLKKRIAEVGCSCFMIGHLTKDGKMKGNSGVPHLVDIECSIIKVLPSRIKLFSDMSSLVTARECTEGNPAAWRGAIKNFCDLVPNMFRYEIGKNRYGPSGGMAIFRHTNEGIEFVDSPYGFDGNLLGRLMQEVSGVPIQGSKPKKAASWSKWWSS